MLNVGQVFIYAVFDVNICLVVERQMSLSEAIAVVGRQRDAASPLRAHKPTPDYHACNDRAVNLLKNNPFMSKRESDINPDINTDIN